MLRRLGSAAAHRPRLVLATWLVILLLGLAAGPPLFGAVTTDMGGNDSVESQRAYRHLFEVRRQLPLDPSDGPDVYAVVDGVAVDDPAVRNSVVAAADAVAALPGVDSVLDAYRS